MYSVVSLLFRLSAEGDRYFLLLECVPKQYSLPKLVIGPGKVGPASIIDYFCTAPWAQIDFEIKR